MGKIIRLPWGKNKEPIKKDEPPDLMAMYLSLQKSIHELGMAALQSSESIGIDDSIQITSPLFHPKFVRSEIGQLRGLIIDLMAEYDISEPKTPYITDDSISYLLDVLDKLERIAGRVRRVIASRAKTREKKVR